MRSPSNGNQEPNGNRDRLRLKLPATSANLGSGFDAVAVALDFHLEIQAQQAGEYSIVAAGRDADRCSRLDDNLILGVYRKLLSENGRPEIPLALRMANGIPLGMGCGSSAAGRLAGIVLAVHFGQLGWNSERILEEGSHLEGHPDNAAACWLGGFVVAAQAGESVQVAEVAPSSEWRAVIALPQKPLATSKARALLPDSYPRNVVVANIQAASLLGLAFAQARGDLLPAAMDDGIHQPYRMAACPLLPRLLGLGGKGAGILGVALSGAGPAVLVVVDNPSNVASATESIRRAVCDIEDPELLVCEFEHRGARRFLEEEGWDFQTAR
jgi:homoserine kinase